VACGEAVKLIAVMLAPLTVTACVVGLNVKPEWLGTTAYVPFANPVKE
jgi:hypothetical protein